MAVADEGAVDQRMPLSSTLLSALAADLPDLLNAVAGALVDLDHGFADFLAGGRDEVLPAAEFAIGYLVAEAAACMGQQAVIVPPVRDDVAWALFEELGRDQWRRDQPVRNLLSAYQLGGRVGWRRIAAVAVGLNVPPDALTALAEAVFRLIDDLSTATIAGYVDEQAQSATVRDRLRDELAECLLSDRADTAAVVAAAAAAGWALPREAAVVLFRDDDEASREAVARMGPGCLLVRRQALSGAILPDPEVPGGRQRLLRTLRGTGAIIGPTVALDRLPESLRVAEVAARTLYWPPAGAGPLFAVEHLDAIIVHGDRRLLEALRAEQLRPLEAAAPTSRAALHQTLRCWLVHMGNRRAVSRELGIHPQTVRYRLDRLQELFGDALEDPTTRLRLLLALGWEHASAPCCRPDPCPSMDAAAPTEPRGSLWSVRPTGHRVRSGGSSQ